MEHATPAAAILFLAFCGLVLYQIQVAKQGKPIFLRKIAGLDSVDDAVGRATEMGRPVMFNPGLDGISPHLFCALASMRHVVEVSARLDMPVLVPVRDPLAYPLAQEFWREAYAQEGRPNIYKAEQCVRYLSTDQSAFGAATAGWIERERPGANFMFGAYGFESLFIAEAGQKAGAIQVAATHSFYQVPFLMMACDFTAFGEEFFAAGAYFSRDPVQVGSLVGQDYAKLVILVLIFLGVALSTFGDPEANPLALLLQYQM